MIQMFRRCVLSDSWCLALLQQALGITFSCWHLMLDITRVPTRMKPHCRWKDKQRLQGFGKFLYSSAIDHICYLSSRRCNYSATEGPRMAFSSTVVRRGEKGAEWSLPLPHVPKMSVFGSDHPIPLPTIYGDLMHVSVTLYPIYLHLRTSNAPFLWSAFFGTFCSLPAKRRIVYWSVE